MILDLKELPVDFTELWGIKEEYIVLHHDIQPILFSGMNQFRNRIVGSLLFDDKDNKTIYYLHLIVDEQDYSELINLKIPYRVALDRAGATYIVQTFYSNLSEIARVAQITDLSEDILPTYESFLMNPIISHSSTYKVHVHGTPARGGGIWGVHDI